MASLKRTSVVAAVTAFFAVLVGVAMAMPTDPDGLRDDCTDEMRLIASTSQATIEQFEIDTEAQLDALEGTPAPASAYYKVMLKGVELIEKEQAKSLKKMNKEADKCIMKLERLGANAGRGDFVEDVRTESNGIIGDSGFLAIEGMHATLSDLLFTF